MHDPTIWFDRHMVRLTYTGITMDSLPLNVYSQNDQIAQSVEAPVLKARDSGFRSRCGQEVFIL